MHTQLYAELIVGVMSETTLSVVSKFTRPLQVVVTRYRMTKLEGTSSSAPNQDISDMARRDAVAVADPMVGPPSSDRTTRCFPATVWATAATTRNFHGIPVEPPLKAFPQSRETGAGILVPGRIVQFDLDFDRAIGALADTELSDDILHYIRDRVFDMDPVQVLAAARAHKVIVPTCHSREDGEVTSEFP